jgi:hypothetical protein
VLECVYREGWVRGRERGRGCEKGGAGRVMLLSGPIKEQDEVVRIIVRREGLAQRLSA